VFETLEDRLVPSAPPLNEFATPDGAIPYAITAGRDGNLWFATAVTSLPTGGFGPAEVGDINPSTHAISEVPTSPGSGNGDGATITAGPGGTLWFGDENGQTGRPYVGEISPSTNAVNEFSFSAGLVGDITAGPGGKLWFTEGSHADIGEFDPTTHAVEQFALPTNTTAYAITSGPQGSLWFTANSGDYPSLARIGEINPTTHVITEYTIPAAYQYNQNPNLSALGPPEWITTGSDGNLWFTYLGSETIGEFNPSTHAVTQFALPGLVAEGITAGPHGDVWFTESNVAVAGSAIGEINPNTHAITEYAVPTSFYVPSGIATGPDGNLWFTDGFTNSNNVTVGAIGELVLNAATVTVTDAGGTYKGEPFPARATATSSAGAAVSGSLTYTYYAGSSVSGTGSPIPPTEAGTYTVVASFTSSDPHYSNAQSSPVTFTIAPATPTVIARDAGGTYNGQPFPASATATGVDGTGVNGSFSYLYYPGTSVTGSGSSTAPSDVGTYTVVATFTSTDPNYGNAQSSPVTFTVANPFTGSYAGTYAGTATASGHNRSISGGVNFTVNNAGVVSVTHPGPGQGSVAVAGNATLTGVGTIGGLSNVSYAYTGTIVIPSTGRIAAQGTWSATFNGGSASGTWSATAPLTPTVTVSDAGGFYNGRSYPASAIATGTGGSVVKGSFAFTYYIGASGKGVGSAIPPVNAGTYTVVASFATSDPNYRNARSVPLVFTIARATPKITVTDGGTYNGRPFPASGKASGVGGVVVAGTFYFSYYAGSSVSGAPLPAAPAGGGTYTVEALFASGNRNYSSAQWGPVTFTITGARPRVTVSAAGGTYNGQPLPASATATGLTGTTVSGSFSFTYYTGRTTAATGRGTAPTDAGTYTVVATFTSTDPNYANGQSAPATYAIAPATPLVAATDLGGDYNGRPFPAGATATGVGGATVDGSFSYVYFTGSKPSGTGSATAPVAAGTYTVVAHFLSSDPNYRNALSSPTTFMIAPPGTLLVTTPSDVAGHSGTSLRDAIATANADAAAGNSDKIIFAPSLAGATITLSQGPLELTAGTAFVRIDGGGRISVSGNNATRVFQVDSGASCLLAGLAIEDGNVASVNVAGAGILNNGTLTVSACTISGNSTPGFGAGIGNYGTLLVAGTSFTHNSAGSPVNQEGGGGIYSAGAAIVTDSTFASNYGWYGGGIYVNGGSVDVSDSTFAGNFGGYGCGIDNAGTVDAVNCTFTGNGGYGSGGTSYDGAIANGGNMNVINCTIYGNAGSNNGGIDNLAALGHLGLVNSIVAGNTAAFGYEPDLTARQSGATVVGNNNIIGANFDFEDIGLVNGVNGNQVGTYLHPINPRLGPLGNHGGPTETMALLFGSPAIGAGGSVVQLGSDLSATATTFEYSLVLPGTAIRIGSEEILVTITGRLVRGYNGTTATAHKAGSLLYLASDQRGVLHGNPTNIGAFQ
jgi:streptogramin lyase